MSYLKQSHHEHEAPAEENAQAEHRPYWKGVHRDWRVWCAVFLMIAGMIVYVMSDDLSVRFRSRPPQSPPVTIRK